MVDSRRKGADWERTVVNYLRDAELYAERTGDTGQHRGDVVSSEWALECKNTKNLARSVNDGIEQNRDRPQPRALVVKRARKGTGDALVVMTLDDWIALRKSHSEALRQEKLSWALGQS